MKKQKNLVTRLLMICSVMLLIALQVVWLKNSYEKSYFDFRKESSVLLKNTVAALRDSLLVRLEGPTNPDSIGRNFMFRRDSLNVKMLGLDSMNVFSERKLIMSQTFRGDSNVTASKSITDGPEPNDQRTIVFHLAIDTLDPDMLAKYFKKNLSSAGIRSPFQIQPIMPRQQQKWPGEIEDRDEWRVARVYSDTIVTEPASFIGPFNSYVAIFSDVKNAILKGIAPQILFSLLLTLIVTTSFAVIYQALRTQQRLNDLKNDFISNVTHELKTPVATVSVALEALKDFHALDNPERAKEYLTIAQNELTRLSLMTDKILKASAFEIQGINYIAENVNLNSIIEQVLASLKFVFEKNKLNVAYTATGTNFDFKGSEIHLTNVIYNLLDNALKYGSNHSSIELTLTASNDYIDFSIRDYGIGIAKEYQKKIFEKFFRVPTGDIHNVKGYGLGLNYVLRVIQKHGGSIAVESEIGRGSFFKIRLPK